ncbi:MAG: hypothetical protein KKG76_10075 [Euryarchaeota archaeon]|nr:hypothetical protein [Euryarchaeota archaeon]
MPPSKFFTPPEAADKCLLVRQIPAQDSGLVIVYTLANYRNIIMKHDLKWFVHLII